MIGKIPVKKLALIVLAVLLSAAVLDLLWWFISPGEAVVYQSGDIFNLDLTQATPVNCVFDASGHHTPANGDPQLVFSLPQEKEIKSVAVRLQQPLRRKGYVQVYYGTDEITEECSVGFSAKVGTREFYFNLPGDKYAFLRLDINADCWLDSVSCSDQPASFLRTPPFRPLRILLVAAVLGLAVFFFSRPKVRKCVRALDHDWINPETRKAIVTVLYAVFAMAMLLHHIVVTLWYPGIAKGTDIKYLRILFPLFAFVSILLGHMWKDKGFWFLAALVVLQYLRLAIPTPVIAADFPSILYAFFGCYSVAKALGAKARKSFLLVFTSVWTTAMFLLCFLGVYAAWSGVKIGNFDTEVISVRAVYSFVYRLHLYYFFGISGTLASAGLSVALVCFCFLRNTRLQLLSIPVCAVMLLASCLTASRTAHFSSALAISLLLCILVYDRLNPQWKKDRIPLFLGKKALLAFILVALVISLVVVQSYIPDSFNYLSRKGVLVSRALAENSPAVHDVVHRDILSADVGSLSNGRFHLWEKVLRIVTSDSSALFLGQSVNQPMSIINADVGPDGTIMGHTHNLWIQTLLESGIPGLFLLFAVQIFFVVHAFRLMKNSRLPFWQRIVPIPALAILIGEILEYTTDPSACYPQLTLLYLFMGFAVSLCRNTKTPDMDQSVRRS